MGQIFIKLTIKNRRDEIKAKDGIISFDQVRSITLSGVCADTGAFNLALPIDVIERLGLEYFKEITANTANGKVVRKKFKDATIYLEDRMTTVECVELPIGSTPLLGAFPMEALGVNPNVMTRQLDFLPEMGENTHIML